MSNQKKLSLLSEVADMYYIQGFLQSEIARKIGLSRVSVSRLLSEAREKKIVEIKINYLSERSNQLEAQLKNLFNLTEIHVFNNDAECDTNFMNMIYNHTAKYVDNILRPNMIFGVTRGNTVAQVMKSLSNKFPRQLDLKIVQLIGSEVNESPNINSGDIIRSLVKTYGGRAYYLNAPMFVERPSLRTDLLNESVIKKTLDIGKKSDIIITGVGWLNADFDINTSIWAGIIKEKVLEELLELGAVGYIFGHIFDMDGSLVKHPINQQVISANFEELTKVKNTIAIACGANRSKAVLGALRTGQIKTLITDRTCAKSLLSLL